MPNEPRWLTPEQVIRLNQRAVAATGEVYHLRDLALLESAVARPVNRWHYGEQDIGALAAQLLVGVARNHPFEQGNKRVALLAALAFLTFNGAALDYPDDELADLIIAMVDHRIEDDAFAAEFQRGVRILPTPRRSPRTTIREARRPR